MQPVWTTHCKLLYFVFDPVENIQNLNDYSNPDKFK